MLRLFTLIIVFISLYFVFSYLGKYDADISFEVYGYHIKTNVFFICALLGLLYILLTVFYKIFTMLLNLPSNVVDFIADYKTKRDTNNILNADNFLIADKPHEAINIAKKYINHSNLSISKNAKMIMSKALKSNDKVNYLQEILNYPDLALYANKGLAETLLQTGDATNALTFANEAHMIDSRDNGALKLLFQIYLKLQLWSKFSYVLEKLNRMCPTFIDIHREEISTALFAAAKKSLEIGDDEEAIKYLEESLSHKPDFLPSINLLSELYNNIGKQELILIIIEKAFSYRPSYELFEIYKNCSNKPVLEIYEILVNSVEQKNLKDSLPIFLKIASSLGLSNKVDELNVTINNATS